VSTATTTLLRSSSVMASGTIVSRLTGVVRNAVVLAAIGKLVFADTYSVANTIPNIVFILLLGGVLNSILVPALTRARSHAAGGEAYTQGLITLTLLALLAVTACAVAAAPLLVRAYADGWTDTQYATSTTFARYLLPQIFFYGLYSLLGQVLNVRGRFGPMMWAPILSNLVIIATAVAFLVVTGHRPPSVATVTSGQLALLGLGTTGGVAAQALCLLPVLRATGFRFRPRWRLRGLGLGKLGSLGGWTFLFVLINQIAYVAVTRMATSTGVQAEAAHADLGGLTAYQNAYLIFLLPHAIATVSLVTALLPRMSASAAEGRLDDVRADIASSLRLTAVVTVPAAAAFVALGPRMAEVLLPGTSNARFIGVLVAAFGVGLVAFSGQHLVLRGFYALEDTRTPALLQIVIAGVNVGLALAAYAWLPLHLKLAGMAAAYALAYVVGLQVSVRLLSRRLDGIEGGAVLRAWLWLAVAAVPAALVAAGVSALLRRLLGESYAADIAELSAALGAFGVVYLALLVRLPVAEAQRLLAMLPGRRRVAGASADPEPPSSPSPWV
jgi:putative peptidoglycan lipid II flippase